MSESVGLLKRSIGPSADSAKGRPSTTPISTMATPIAVASPTFPGRMRYIQVPVISAAMIVATMVNMPQELSLNAFTTTMATLARVTMTMKSVASEAVNPEKPPMLFWAIFGSESPSSRTEAHKTTKSCTAPAMQAPMMIQT